MGQAFEDLVVWQRAMALVKAVYLATRLFPPDEIYGLTAQLRRAATSIPCNIAEGRGRLSEKEFRHFLGMARGSLLEVRTQVLIARDLHYMDDNQVRDLLAQTDEVGRLLNGLLATLRQPAPEVDGGRRR